MREVATGGSSNGRKKVKALQKGWHREQESETLCRKGGTSRSDNAPLASGACAGAKLALWCHPFCDAGICGACAGAKLACGSSHDHYARSSSRLRGSVFTSRDNFLLAHFVANSFISRDNSMRNF